jgi:hypothetical protein
LSCGRRLAAHPRSTAAVLEFISSPSRAPEGQGGSEPQGIPCGHTSGTCLWVLSTARRDQRRHSGAQQVMG